ncbi:MAG: hypothetical protein KatS3mg076_1978 [Candidatus Binatia bacterium]|nr:MAG: hypothetical protein KatS3mg076_1978 [Candidatus Binatia bacterium]
MGRERSECIRTWLFAVAFWPALALATAPVDGTPRALIEHLADQVIAVLRDPALSQKEKAERIEEIAYDNVDVETVTRLVLARHYRRFTPEQRREFVEEFKQHLLRTYGEQLDEYRNVQVEILGEREEARGDWTVQTKVKPGNAEEVYIDYRLRKKDGRWKIIDVVIERVSLVANFRSQFQEILSTGTPEKLLEMLREKNRAEGDGGTR